MKTLDLMRLEGLQEWQFVAEAIEVLAGDFNSFAADAPNMERKEYYRGLRDGLRRALLVPKEVLETKDETTREGVEYPS